MFDLANNKALITGASGDIGAAIARILHGAGAEVCLSGTRREKLDMLASELGSRVHVVSANLSQREAVDALATEAETAMGSVDILVNNAGVTADNLMMRLKDEDWDSILEVNLTAGFRLTRALLRGMMKRRYGRIIGISSLVGTAGNAGQANYAASKAGMVGYTKSLAQEVASRGITANIVAPGFIATAMTEALDDKQHESSLARIPAGRFGASDEIAAAVLYLASAEAGYVTGQTIHVNGGMVMV